MDTGAASDIGKVRERQEDAFLCAPERHLLIVADGLGGHAAGEVASRMTVERLDELLSAERLADSDDVAVMIAESLHEAQGVVLADERANPAHHGMGTTAVVVHVATDRRVATVANLGDSRCYVMRRDELAQVTVDHVWTSPSGRSLTQAIGSSDGIEPELFEVTLESGDRLLLCTDGLTDMVDDPGIAEVLGTAETAQGAADGLVAAALDRGGQDNITVVVAFVD
ncbi:MAG: SpoIIE family protein phosphatase [Actinobacteria bacterium]|nr:SpoIIE family protein phosphatase [Actinomycetota bacterium]